MHSLKLSVVGICAIFTLSGCDKMAQNQLNEIEKQVADDAVKQYEMARTGGGTAIDICVQAGLVSASFLQAGDQANYTTWKAREKIDCAAAGVRQ